MALALVLMPSRILFVLLLASFCALAQQEGRPLGLVTSAAGAQIRPAGRNLPLTLAPGDLLFAGDAISTAAGEARIAFCPNSAIVNLARDGEYSFTATNIRTAKGSATSVRDIAACELPIADPAVTRSVRELARGAGVALDIADLADDSTRFPALMESLKKIEPRKRLLVLEKAPAAQPSPTAEAPLGPTYALIVGISKYEKLPRENWLRFADADAQKFGEFVFTPRGGNLQPDRMKLLTNEEATKASVARFIKLFLDEAKKTHGTFLLVMAAHGIADETTGEASIVTTDSDLQDLYTSGFSMDELQDLLGDGLAGIGRMLIFLDVCHASKLGTIKSRNVNRALLRAVPSQYAPGKILSFTSSSETEASWEGENWGGGHGAFSYFILRGLYGDADADQDGVVTARELVTYVSAMVKQSTLDEQHPNSQTFTVVGEAQLAAKSDPAQFTLSAEWKPLERDKIARRQGRKDYTPPTAARREIEFQEPRLREFEAAIRDGRLLPGTPGSAFDLLQGPLRPALDPSAYSFARTELLAALENQGQRAILRYLEGDQVEQRADSFRNAAPYFQAARQLAPDVASIESRELFCRGRESIFLKTPQGYGSAVTLLENAARLDPRGAYSFNALGIAYLEQAPRDAVKFSLAIAAFQDAIRLAPHWVYPRHNLALAYAERGQYDLAIRAYRDAMRVGPNYSYLPYNLGLLYQRLNRLNDAEQSYRDALGIAQSARDSGIRPAAPGQWREGADIHNALGSIESARSGGRHRDNAEKFYRQALLDDDRSHAARHNLALLLSRDHQSPEAEQLWRRNLADDANDIASRLALADYFDRIGRSEDAAREYQAAIGGANGFPGVRRKLAAALVKLDRVDEARAVLEQALQDSPSPNLLEDLGDLEAHAGRSTDAIARYRDAETKFVSRSDQARVRKKRERAAIPGDRK
jgi:tetratricopeptide (TPR) repeat protein